MTKDDKDEIKSAKAIILDLDGIITQTAKLHLQAWKEMFDAFLKNQHVQSSFTEEDYFQYVDGKPRYAGVRSFLESRDITLTEGSQHDESSDETVFGLGKRKNEIFIQLLTDQGANIYEDTLDKIKQWKAEGKKLAVVSSSKNCRPVLEKAGLISLFDVIVDGKDAEKKSLKGKPDPDIFVEAARELGVKPYEAVVFEDAISGVEAGHRGQFALVVGVNRQDEAQKMYEAGADIVINTLSELP